MSFEISREISTEISTEILLEIWMEVRHLGFSKELPPWAFITLSMKYPAKFP